MKITLYISHRQNTYEEQGCLHYSTFNHDWDSDLFPIRTIEVEVEEPELHDQHYITQTRISRLEEKKTRIQAEAFRNCKEVDEEIAHLQALTYSPLED